jgi:hypothetical protein
MTFESKNSSVLKMVDTGNISAQALSSKIKRKHVVKKGISYEIINYDKDMVCFDDDETAKFRSVVCDPATKQILSFSPAKSVDYSTFKEKVNICDVIITEIVEGTMIQLFYDFRIEKWEIATKGNVGGNYWYYRTEYANPEYGNYNEIPSQKTFKEMFLDAFQWDKNGDLNPKKDVNDIDIFDEFPKNACYTFVLQHPDNHIVGNYEFACVYLVAVHKINNRGLYGEMCEYVDGKWNGSEDNENVPSIEVCMPREYENWPCMKVGVMWLAMCPILFPNTVNVKTYEELEFMLSQVDGAFPMGYMLLDMNSGNRAHIENPQYVELKALRGNNPNLQFHYFSLLRGGKVNDYLFHFPAYKKQFHDFEMQYKTFIHRVHQSYLIYYVKKSKVNIAKKYFIHASKIHHNIYLPAMNKKEVKNDGDGNGGSHAGIADDVTELSSELNNMKLHDSKVDDVPANKAQRQNKPKNKGTKGKPVKKVITLDVVREYFDSMTPQNIIYYLNYELRK